MAFWVGILFAVSLTFQLPSETTLRIASGGAVASLGFGYAALTQGKEHDLAKYVGARFGFSAVFLVTGFVLDYALVNAFSVLPFAVPTNPLLARLLVLLFGLCRLVLYVGAVVSFGLGTGLTYAVFKDKDEPPSRSN